jgi:hypothetical protein
MFAIITYYQYLNPTAAATAAILVTVPFILLLEQDMR